MFIGINVPEEDIETMAIGIALYIAASRLAAPQAALIMTAKGLGWVSGSVPSDAVCILTVCKSKLYRRSDIVRHGVFAEAMAFNKVFYDKFRTVERNIINCEIEAAIKELKASKISLN